MNKIFNSNNKVLKLSNVLKNEINLTNDETVFEIAVEQMKTYIKLKGVLQTGPLIEHMVPFVNDSNEIDMKITMMLQCNNYIHSVKQPYSMESLIRIPNCMYCRYIGPEDKLKFAYDKINLEAFEEDIPLKGDSYTIFVDQKDEQIIADVFMERADHG